MGAMSIGHWLIVLAVALLIFGPKRLGDVGKGLGQGIKGLRDGLSSKDPDPTPGGTDHADKADGTKSA